LSEQTICSASGVQVRVNAWKLGKAFPSAIWALFPVRWEPAADPAPERPVRDERLGRMVTLDPADEAELPENLAGHCSSARLGSGRPGPVKARVAL